MVKEKLLDGGIVIKNEEVVGSYMEEGKKATVQTALLFRLRAYLHSLGKSLSAGEPNSFVAVGAKTVFIIMKILDYECGLFVPRDKFKDAIDKWKTKVKTISE
jgi:hypothetical protein